MVRIQEKKGQYVITIPNEYIRFKKWVKGQELLIAFNERGNLELREVPAN